MKVSTHIEKTLAQKLAQYRILVWYDSECAFGDFVARLRLPNVKIVSGIESTLHAVRKAQELYLLMEKPGASLSDKNSSLLIYVPRGRETDTNLLPEQPFENFAHIGAAFGDTEADQLRSLAIRALPEFADQIEDLFRNGKPTLALLDSLEKIPTYPLVNQAFGTRSTVDVAALILGDKETLRKITGLAGCATETLRLLADELGFAPPAGTSDWNVLRTLLARYILFSEFVLDLDAPLPAALANLSHAPAEYRDRIEAIASRLRDSHQFRETYLELASSVERDLELPHHFDGLSSPGARDTFAFEERIHLHGLTQAADAANLVLARQIIHERRASVWRHQFERAQVWTVAERCITLLEIADRTKADWKREASNLKAMVTTYTRPESGWFELDRAQRLMEQSIAECTIKEEVESLIEKARAAYRDLADAIQRRFMEQVESAGWPPDEFVRQTQIYDRFVAPALASREKIAYVLADSLRFEMGHDLAQSLSDLGQVNLEVALAALPTITEVGMAALLPGADGALTFRLDAGEPIPCIGNKPLKNLSARIDFLREKLGDRLADIEISQFLEIASAQKQSSRLKNADLVILRDTRIDQLGENVSLKEARRYMTDMLGDLRSAVVQLARLGYSRVVIVSDHGHVLLPEIRAGDVVTQSPPGEWAWNKRRFRLGRMVQEHRGARVFNASHLGIRGDLPDLVLPDGFGLYSQGSGYFHGGLSLQESLIPIISLTVAQPPQEQPGTQEIKILYRSNTFTSRVLGLKIWYNSLMAPELRVKVEAFDGSGAKATRVGEAAECDARDEISRQIMLRAGQETPVPILLDADYNGNVEIRVSNPDTPIVWARLTLKNGIMD